MRIGAEFHVDVLASEVPVSEEEVARAMRMQVLAMLIAIYTPEKEGKECGMKPFLDRRTPERKDSHGSCLFACCAIMAA